MEREIPVSISIVDIFTYFNPAKRPLIWGEEIANKAGRILGIGRTSQEGKIMAKLVRSTLFTAQPHEIILKGLHLQVGN